MLESFRTWLEGTEDALYVRFGQAQTCSGCWLGQDFDRKGELGLSVYQARRLIGSPGDWPIKSPNTYFRIKKRPGEYFEIARPNTRQAIYQIGSDYWEHMLGMYARANRPIHLLTGKLAEIELYDRDEDRVFTHAPHGADGEPLLDPGSVRVVKALEPWQILAGGKLADEYGNWNEEESDGGI